LAVALAAGGCGNDPQPPSLMAGVGATWNWKPSGPDQLGYAIAAVIEQRAERGADTCAELPSTTQATINGLAIPLVTNPNTHCVTGQLALGPFVHDQSVSVRIADGNDVMAAGMFENLMPGTSARLITPADGKVREGDEVVLVPPAALPSSQAAAVYLFVPGSQSMLYALAQRQPDGNHFKAPSFVGDAAVVVRGMPYTPDATFSCSGFAVCVGDADNTVGPIFITEEP